MEEKGRKELLGIATEMVAIYEELATEMVATFGKFTEGKDLRAAVERVRELGPLSPSELEVAKREEKKWWSRDQYFGEHLPVVLAVNNAFRISYGAHNSYVMACLPSWGRMLLGANPFRHQYAAYAAHMALDAVVFSNEKNAEIAREYAGKARRRPMWPAEEPPRPLRWGRGVVSNIVWDVPPPIR